MTQEKKGLHYEVPVTYAEALPVGEDGALVEVERTEVVKVLYLQRINRAHSKIGMMLIEPNKSMGDMAEIAEKFAECAILDDCKAKKAILKDLFACVNIFHSDKVQEDIESFLPKLDFVRGAMKTAEAE